jgi:O-antigen/teichoic acid export membrane protein
MTDEAPAHRHNLQKLLKVARGRLGRQTAVTLVIRVGALGLALLVAIVLARMLGTESYGAYSLAFAWVQILLIPGLLGMDSLMVRETARLQQSEPERSRSYALWSTKAVLATSVIAAIVIGGPIVALQASQRPEVVLAQAIALFLLPMMAVTGTWQAILRAIDRMYIGQFPESILVPVLILAGATLVAASSIDLTPAEAIGLRIVGIAGAVLILGPVLYRALPPGPIDRLARLESRALMRSSFALGLIGAVFLLVTRTDVVMLGILSDLESVGSYTVASAGASLVVFPFIGLNTVLAPTIAALHTAGDRRQMQRILTWGSRGALVAALPLAIVLVSAGSLYLSLFGDGFDVGLGPLRILTLGTFVASAAGSAGMIMIMTGHEVVTAKVVGGSAVLNVILNLALIPPLGAAGAAIATAVTTNVWTVLLVVWIRRNLRVDPTIMGVVPRDETDA